MSDCIEGKGNAFSGKGYRTIMFNGKRVYQHRLVAVLFHGLDMQDTTTLVLHSCDNPKCINPEHLRLGSVSDNMQDYLSRHGGNKKGMNGDKNPKAKLTKEQVQEIRNLKKENPKLTYVDIAKNYGVNDRTIALICKGKSWL